MAATTLDCGAFESLDSWSIAGEIVELQLRKLILPILDRLREAQNRVVGYDLGGIHDPLDFQVIGDHYGTTHFSWLSALWYRIEPSPELLEQARLAIDFHLRTSPEEYLPGDWDYHWDFNNLAFVETYLLLEEQLSDRERAQWLKGLTTWKTNQHQSVNWLAMRAAAAWLRGDITGKQNDYFQAADWLDYVLSAQLPDGGIQDVVSQSQPSQYHAYTACLLHRMIQRDKRIAPAVVRAARWLLAVTGPDGDMNAVGRGQGQIFGYACAVYLFKAAILLDNEMAPCYRWAIDKIAARLHAHRTESGWLPLVLNKLPVSERAGWYDYHHLSVYNAFSAVWLMLAEQMIVPDGPAAPPPEGELLLSDSGLLTIRRQNIFALFSTGMQGAGYVTEAGITPHLLMCNGAEVFRYPLGPEPGKYGRCVDDHRQVENQWSPLWRTGIDAWSFPGGAKGSIRRDSNNGRWLLQFSRDGAVWKRSLLCGNYFLEVRDSLSIPTLQTAVAGRSVNLSLPAEAVTPGSGDLPFVNDGHFSITGWSISGKGQLTRQGETLAAAGKMALYATPEEGRSAAPFRGAWRLRCGPGDKPGPIPGIVCLSWDPWSSLWKRKQKLLYEMAGTGRCGTVLYVEPPTSITRIVENPRPLLTGGNDEGRRFRRCFGRKIHEMGPHFKLLSPLSPYPGQRTIPALAQVNRNAWTKQVNSAVKNAVFPKGYVLWLYHPSQIHFLDSLAERAELIVFDWTDDWVAAYPPDRPEMERKKLAMQQKQMLCRADVVFAVSTTLFKRAKRSCQWVYHLPNATDSDVFKPALPNSPPPPILTGLSRPVLLYLSQITDRVDFELIAAVARTRPEWNLLMVGPVVCSENLLAPIRGLSNVILTGAVPYHEAAVLVAQSDVCILPHKEDSLTGTLDPIKLYDYLATGRPIVTTDVAMHLSLRPHVSIASSSKAFVTAIDKALAEDPRCAAIRLQASCEHTWIKRADSAVDIIGRFFK